MTTKLFGVNISGGEYKNPIFASTNTGYKGFAYYAEKGFTLIRIPVAWEHIQADLNAQPNRQTLHKLRLMLDEAARNNQKVILDVHNSARFQGIPLVSDNFGDFANLWKHLSIEFCSHPALFGYELMNEPHSLAQRCYTWRTLVEAAITMIRLHDRNSYILVPGYAWQGANCWSEESNGLHTLSDKENKLLFAAHQYFDKDGTYRNASPIPISQVRKQLESFLTWLDRYNKQGIITEFGAPADAVWLPLLDAFLKELVSHSRIVGAVMWAGGQWWSPDYPLLLEPTNGKDKPQVQLLARYAQKLIPI